MDRHRIELQLRVILLTYRVEHRRRDSPTMRKFRERASTLLDELEPAARRYPDLGLAIDEARRQLAADGSPSRGDGAGGET